MTSITTAEDYIREQEILEAEARELLPFKADLCTQDYDKNEIGKPLRQAIYLCKTCGLDKGVCVGCSIICHGDHDLLELFPKRGFVCDCPTSRFSKECSLKKLKATYDSHPNHYNHNFQRRFCACDQIYEPAECDQEMYQCLSCEDWFHEGCLNLRDKNQEGRVNDENSEDAGPVLRLPRSKFDAFVCSECVLSPDLEHLRRYAGTPSFVLLESMKSLPQEGDDDESAIPLKFSNKREHSEDGDYEENDVKRAKTGENESQSVPQEETIQACKVPAINEESQQFLSNLSQNPPPKPPSEAPRADMFMLHGWRDKWCKCENCMTKLSKHPWLFAEEATYEPQEEEQEEKTLLQLGAEALNTLPREKALDGLKAYEKMSSSVKDFLKPFADTGKTVEAADINNFFSEQQQKLKNGDNQA
ncbi:hypothetical protein E3Q09_00008 [Wallemia mellicola]|nr:hypothetical protein E3Q09_00008 [Wallemia mellicola]